ncbi:MAG: cyclodeaminase/cyclohydrolase family protein, partial [Candidatus Acidiferrales bacterium]
KKPASLAALAEPLLAAVAEPTPTPGGGSCAAVAGALAAGLGEMVARLSAAKKSLAQNAGALQQLSEEFAALRARLQAAIDRDADSFEAVLAALRLPKASDEEKQARQDAVERATQSATEIPLEVAEAATAVLDSLARLAPLSSPSMASDVNTGAHLAVAALRGALENARINLDSVRDPGFQKNARARAEKLESRLGEATPVSG